MLIFWILYIKLLYETQHINFIYINASLLYMDTWLWWKLQAETRISALSVEEILGLERLLVWLAICPVQGRELVQLAVGLKVPISNPGCGKLQLLKPTYE